MEKESLTPDVYPLSLNSLVTACNQTSSRFPITTLTADEVMEALPGLSEKYLVEKVPSLCPPSGWLAVS
ncbi:YceH family protein [bacterium]|nr:YceH family protein [bacterium]